MRCQKSIIFVAAFLSLVGFYGIEPAMPQEPKISIMNTDGKEVGQASLTDGPNGIVVGLSFYPKTADMPGICPTFTCPKMAS